MGSICRSGISLVSDFLSVYFKSDVVFAFRIVLYHMPARQDAAAAKADLARREEELAELKKKHNIGDE